MVKFSVDYRPGNYKEKQILVSKNKCHIQPEALYFAFLSAMIIISFYIFRSNNKLDD